LTNASYRTEADVTSAAARLDFKRLLDSGLIVQQGSGRATRYRASTALEEYIATNGSPTRVSVPRRSPTVKMTASPSAGAAGDVRSTYANGPFRK